MRIVLYSGGRTSRNEVIHDALSGLVGSKKRKSFTYIPSCKEQDDVYFARAERRYRRFGFTDFTKLRADGENPAGTLEKALAADVVYLAGGNTFYFLKHLKRRGLASRLRRYARDGGILAGLSAGGIILTPDIGLAGYPSFDADANEVGLRDLRGLNLLPFEFFPHYGGCKRLEKALVDYSKATARPVLACHDGGGVLLRPGRTEFIGEVHMLLDGVQTAISAG